MFIRLILFLFLSISNVNALEDCKWNNTKGIPCTVITKTPNTSKYNSEGINKKIFTKQEILKSGASTTIDLLKKVSGLDYYQTGQKGQQAAIFMRGSESNHTLVMLNGVAINDQSTTNGLHDFGQDFVQTIQQIEIYKGPSGAHFGPSAIGGAINFVTTIDYVNKFSVGGYNSKNNFIDTNYTKITDNGWHLNFKGSNSNNKTNSARYVGKEDDSAKNYQINVNAKKWIDDFDPSFVSFIEPGTPDTFKSILSMRDVMKEKGYKILYPCSSLDLGCPMSGTQDWCHQVLKVVHDPWVERLCQLVSKNRRVMPMIGHVYSKETHNSVQPEGAKNVTLIRVLKETKFSFQWQVCLNLKNEFESNLNHSLITVDVLKKYYSKKDQKILKKVSVGEVVFLNKLKEASPQNWHVEIVDFKNWIKKIPS